MPGIDAETLLRRDLEDSAYGWLRTLEAVAGAPGAGRSAAIFDAEAAWRNYLCGTWTFDSWIGCENIDAALSALTEPLISNVRLHPQRPPTSDAEGTLTVVFEFDGPNGPASGVAQLARSHAHDPWVAASVMTKLDGLRDYKTPTGERRPIGKKHAFVPKRPRWRRERERAQAHVDRDPQVLIVGAGHCGLMMAARFQRLGISALIVEQTSRVGDVWRNRYASLALHDPIWMDHLPHLPFPDTWPALPPKDVWADYLESYAQILALDVWTSSRVQWVHEPDESDRWTVSIHRGDGEVRALRPRHLIFASGLNGAPNIPDIPGRADFGGAIVHAGAFEGGEAWEGKRAVVVGAGVSGHEVALDLAEYGVDTTIVQRSSTHVVDVPTFWKRVLTPYLDQRFPVEFADMVANSMPPALQPVAQQEATRLAAEDDREILDGLRSRGFALNDGPEGRGVVGAHVQGIDGYHQNIGAAQKIIDGTIGVKSGVEVASFAPGRVEFTDGTNLAADLVVLATGYRSILDSIRSVLGPIGSRIGTIYAQDANGEYGETWSRSSQDGLWFATGPIGTARFYSQLLALQIAGIELGHLSYRKQVN